MKDRQDVEPVWLDVRWVDLVWLIPAVILAGIAALRQHWQTKGKARDRYRTSE